MDRKSKMDMALEVARLINSTSLATVDEKLVFYDESEDRAWFRVGEQEHFMIEVFSEEEMFAYIIRSQMSVQTEVEKFAALVKLLREEYPKSKVDTPHFEVA